MSEYLTSYSGADFTFLLYLPVKSDANQYQVGIDELEDEIIELEARIDLLSLQLQTVAVTQSSLRSSLTKRITSLQTTISKLKGLQGKIRESKANIIPVRLDTLQTLSMQMHVDKQPVRALGHSYPKGYTRGATLVAGSMIFTVLKEHPLARVMDMVNAGREHMSKLSSYKPGRNSYDLFPTSATPAQLPPMHMTILGVNEAGNAVTSSIYGLEFINDGVVFSINDNQTEISINFVAQDVDLLRTLDTRGALQIPAFSRAVTASSFLTTDAARLRRARRGSPF